MSERGPATAQTGVPVDLFEYQAKDLFSKHGVPTLPGGVATTPDEDEHVGGIALAQEVEDQRHQRHVGA